MSCGSSPQLAALPAASIPVAPVHTAPSANVATTNTLPVLPCQEASTDIARLREADQDARKHLPTAEEWPRISAADLERRTRVSELFAAGCLTTAADYGSAALIFQHGTVPEHYLEAVLFASRALALGDTSEKSLIALAADRFLVSTKHRQLFGSQSFRVNGNPCWCMQQVERSFPDVQRVLYVGKTLEQERQAVTKMNAETTACTKIECDDNLRPTPKGSVPGVW
jgi:hypothetical protein